MQNKNTKNYTKKEIRRMHERIGALVIVGGTLVSLAAISSEARRLMSQLAVRPAYAVIEHSGKENETARHPVNLDRVLRAPSVSGS